jgi:hypothetical protein
VNDDLELQDLRDFDRIIADIGFVRFGDGESEEWKARRRLAGREEEVYAEV